MSQYVKDFVQTLVDNGAIVWKPKDLDAWITHNRKAVKDPDIHKIPKPREMFARPIKARAIKKSSGKTPFPITDEKVAFPVTDMVGTLVTYAPDLETANLIADEMNNLHNPFDPALYNRPQEVSQ